MVARFSVKYAHSIVKAMFYAESRDGIAARSGMQTIAEWAYQWHSLRVIRCAFLVGIAGLCALASAGEARPPLGDPVALNIGINCQWQQNCMKTQSKAMKRALKYVKKTELPPWRLQMCNRN